jgi:hypothetical protein
MKSRIADAGHDVPELRAQARRAVEKLGEPIHVSVCAHRFSMLPHPRSLEHWLRRFESDEIIYDPTLVVSRGRSLLLTTKSCWSAFGDAICGLFFDPDRRTLFVLKRGRAAAAMAVDLQVRAVLE